MEYLIDVAENVLHSNKYENPSEFHFKHHSLYQKKNTNNHSQTNLKKKLN